MVARLFLVLSLFCLSQACNKEPFKLEEFADYKFLFADYNNTAGNNPNLVIDNGLSSKGVLLGGAFVGGVSSPTRVEVSVSGVKLKDDFGVHSIKEIVTEEYRNGKWEVDKENFLKHTASQSLDIVLVLDVSSSLGDDLSNVKQYARDFVSTVFENNQNSRIAIVAFSDNISVLDFKNLNENYQIESFVNNLQSADATKLYEAMDQGLQMLSGSSADGKAIVTFTDGKNNAWSNGNEQKYSSVNYVYDNVNASGFSSYTIGFKGKGDIDEEALKKLAVKGTYAFPTSSTDLQKVFKKFANSVAAVYTFTYERNSSQISSTLKLRFKIKTLLL